MAYGSITYALFWHMMFRQNEVAHDDLRDASNDILRAIGQDLDEPKFQRLVDYLWESGVIQRQYSAHSIKNVREWRRRPYYYWLTDEGFRLMQLLQHGLGLRDARPFGDVGKDYLRGLETRLDQIANDLREATKPRANQPVAERQDHLRKAYRDLRYAFSTDFQQFRDFLTKLNGYLVEFSKEPTVSFDKLQRVREWLQSYVEDMLAYFRDASRRVIAITKSLDLEMGEQLQFGYEFEKLDAMNNPFDPPTPVSHPHPRDLLRPLGNYFRRRGGLDDQADRIRESTSATIRRLEEHYRRLAESRYTIQLLDARMREIRSLDWAQPDRQARVQAWLNQLFFPGLIPFAHRIGTPAQQGKPPEPKRRHEYVRPEQTDITAAQLSDDDAGILGPNPDLAAQINDFVEQRILRGADSVPLERIHVNDLHEFRTLLLAVKNDELYLHAPLHKYFRFRVRDPVGSVADPIRIIQWTGRDGTYTGPNLTFERKPAEDAP